MTFSKPLRPRVMSGEITKSVRIWQTSRVRVGGRYPLGGGYVEVTHMTEIDRSDVTEAMAHETGFASLEDLMGVAQHGRGERVFLVEFEFHED